MTEKKKKGHISRRAQREVAFQLLYELNIKENTIKKNDELEYFLDEESNESLQEKRLEFINKYFELRQLDAQKYDYVQKTAKLYVQNTDDIEKLLEQNIHGWKVSRVGKTEISIIRLATVEMLFIDDVPPAVAINEAVELTKVFADEKAYRFVNKVLRNIYESIKTIK